MPIYRNAPWKQGERTKKLRHELVREESQSVVTGKGTHLSPRDKRILAYCIVGVLIGGWLVLQRPFMTTDSTTVPTDSGALTHASSNHPSATTTAPSTPSTARPPTMVTPSKATPPTSGIPLTTVTPSAVTVNISGPGAPGRAYPGSDAHTTSFSSAQALIQPDGSARPLTGDDAIAVLNEQRYVNGIPPIVRSDNTLASFWCPNEKKIGKAKIAGNYSPYGQWDAALTPWDNALAHQFSLYDPNFTAAGESDGGSPGQACLGLARPLDQPASPTFYAYVSGNGYSLVPASENVPGEYPYAPEQLVGIPLSTATGPQLIFYALGFPGEVFADPSSNTAVRVLSWSLSDLSNSSEVVSPVRMVDHRVARHMVPWDASSYNDGAIMIPPPLRPGTSYAASVLWRGPTGLRRRQSITFSTGLSANMSILGRSSVLSVSTKSPQPVQMSIEDRGHLTQTTLVPRNAYSMHIAYNTNYSICAYQVPGRGYSMASACVSLSWEGTSIHPSITVSLGR